MAAKASLIAVLLGLLLLAAGLQVAGYDAGAALAALWRGAFGSWYALTSATLVRAIPLIIIGLGIALAFRGGALNIGAEGQFYAGAIAATWVGLHVAGRPAAIALPAVLAASLLAGGAWVLVPVWLQFRYGVLEVISTLLLNFVAESLVSLMVQGPLQESQHIYPQSDPIAAAARLPVLPGHASTRGCCSRSSRRQRSGMSSLARSGASGCGPSGPDRARRRSAAESMHGVWPP